MEMVWRPRLSVWLHDRAGLDIMDAPWRPYLGLLSRPCTPTEPMIKKPDPRTKGPP